MTEYTVTIHPAEEGGFWVEVPALPGCFTQGETLDDAMHNAKEAIEAHILALKKEKVKIPQETELVIGRVAVHLP